MQILTLALVVLTANAAKPLPVAIPPSNEPVAVALDLGGPMPSRWEASGKGWAGRGEEVFALGTRIAVHRAHQVGGQGSNAIPSVFPGCFPSGLGRM
jgi:hypothetical protein